MVKPEKSLKNLDNLEIDLTTDEDQAIGWLQDRESFGDLLNPDDLVYAPDLIDIENLLQLEENSDENENEVEQSVNNDDLQSSDESIDELNGNEIVDPEQLDNDQSELLTEEFSDDASE